MCIRDRYSIRAPKCQANFPIFCAMQIAVNPRAAKRAKKGNHANGNPPVADAGAAARPCAAFDNLCGIYAVAT